MKRRAPPLVLLLVLAVGMPVAGHTQGGSREGAGGASGAGADLRAAYATPPDIAEGRRVAEASCGSCHGLAGISAVKGVPHLAGQRPGYLYAELLAYQRGARTDKAMGNAVKFLKDDALVKVAAYYAAQEPASPQAPAAAKAAPAKPDTAGVGKGLAAGCAGCHGETGISKTPGTPSLVGLDPEYLVATMKAYKGGQRKHDMMKTLVSALSEGDMNAIALHYAGQKAAKAQTPSPGNQTAGKAAGAACGACHGDGGVSGTPANPSLAGQDAQYLVAALGAYKGGSRSDATMKAPAAALDDNAMKDVAAYFANQQPQQPRIRKSLTTLDLVQRCDRCHGLAGNSTDPRSPALAAQRADYLDQSMRAYRKGERKSSAMAAMLEGLSDADIESLAAYYASQKARSVVYVILPPAK